MQFQCLFIIAFLASSSLAQTVSQVKNDFKDVVHPAVKDFVNRVTAFPIQGGTVDQAMAIHKSVIGLNYAALVTVNDINDVPSQFSDTDCMDIVGYVGTLAPGVTEALKGMDERKPAFEPFEGVIALMKKDIKTMKMSTDNFMKALSSHCSPEVIEPTLVLKSASDMLFFNLMSTYM